MKKTQTLKLIVIGLSVLLFASCEESLIGIKGSGSVVSNEVELSEINGVSLELSGNIHLTQGDEQSIVIEAQQNIFDNIDISVHNGVAEFDFDRNVTRHDGLNIYITLHDLTQVSLEGSGDINTTNTFNLNKILKVNISGSGDINLQANVPEIRSSISGSGNLRLQLNTEYFEADISGSGDYNLTGTTTASDLYVSGSGNFSALDFISKETAIDISGSGDAKVYASERLDVNISGSGDVRYKGYPTINSNISGSGNIKSVN